MSLWAAQNIEETVCSWQDVRLGKVADLEEMDACRAKLISCFVVPLWLVNEEVTLRIRETFHGAGSSGCATVDWEFSFLKCLWKL